MKLPLRSIQVGLLSLGSFVLFALAMPSPAKADAPWCSGAGGTCEIPCSSGSHPALSTDFSGVGATNDCPKDGALKLQQYCCIKDPTDFMCKSVGGSCDSGSSCASGKTELPYDCGAGSTCCKGTATTGSSSSGSGSTGSKCNLAGGVCIRLIDATARTPIADAGSDDCAATGGAGWACYETSLGSSGGSSGSVGTGGVGGTGGSSGTAVAGGCTAPASLKDSCSAGEFQSFYDSTAHQYCCSPLTAAVIACDKSGGSCKSKCSTTEKAGSSCENAAKEICCIPNKSAAASGAGGLKPVAAGAFRLQLPTCISDGNCELQDIVDTGANAANFFTTLSAALFFLSFVYGGARYLLSFGRKEWVTAGTKAMTTSALGMAIVMFAWVIVNYVANAVQGK